VSAINEYLGSTRYTKAQSTPVEYSFGLLLNNNSVESALIFNLLESFEVKRKQNRHQFRHTRLSMCSRAHATLTDFEETQPPNGIEPLPFWFNIDYFKGHFT
jgi:hypothetical protein